MVAMHSHMSAGVFATIFRTKKQRAEEEEARRFAQELLDYVGIGYTTHEYARNLSYGDQRRLEVARALALRPSVLLLDEPSEGLSPVLVDELARIFNEIRAEGTGLLMVEQHLNLVRRVSQRFVVMAKGEIIDRGLTENIDKEQHQAALAF